MCPMTARSALTQTRLLRPMTSKSLISTPNPCLTEEVSHKAQEITQGHLYLNIFSLNP